MALTNAEKQHRWRAAHAKRRRTAARIAGMLLHAPSEGEAAPYPVKVGWNTAQIDRHAFKLAILIADLLSPDKTIKQDQAIKRLHWALRHRLSFRTYERETRRERDPQMRAAREQWIEERLSL
jgi:hypothetical protein